MEQPLQASGRSNRHDVGAEEEEGREGRSHQAQGASRNMRESTEAQGARVWIRAHTRNLRSGCAFRYLQTYVCRGMHN
eukprot:3812454-Pleurochrysis_carterae.AAC.1